jgi:hypothetical protein
MVAEFEMAVGVNQAGEENGLAEIVERGAGVRSSRAGPMSAIFPWEKRTAPSLMGGRSIGMIKADRRSVGGELFGRGIVEIVAGGMPIAHKQNRPKHEAQF